LLNTPATVTSQEKLKPIAVPFVTSGIRLGTPAITAREIKPGKAWIVARVITDILNNP